MERIGNKVSYIKKPFAKCSLVAVGLILASLVFGVPALWLGYHTRGNAPLFAAALGLCSAVTALSAFVYGILSFFEKEKNYLLAKISLAVAAAILAVWVLMVVTVL